jgi:tetratricopeptide (TPR) repeat protein
MKKIKKYLFAIIITSFLNFYSIAQVDVIDSLKLELINTKQDSVKLRIIASICEKCDLDEIMTFAIPGIKIINQNLKNKKLNSYQLANIINLKAHIYNNIGFYYENNGNYTTAIKYFDTSLVAFTKINHVEGIISNLNSIGLDFNKTLKFNTSLNYFQKAILLSEKFNINTHKAEILNNMGALYNSQGMTKKALEYYSKCLKFSENNNDLDGIAYSLSNIATIYDEQNNSNKAIEFYKKSLDITQKLGDKSGIAGILNKIGIIYISQKKYALGEDCFTKALKACEESGDVLFTPTIYQNIAALSLYKGDTLKYYNYNNKSIAINKKYKNQRGLAIALRNNAVLLFHQSSKNKISPTLILANKYSDSALTYAKISNNISSILECELTHSQIDSAMGNFEKAYKHFKQYVLLKDSINNINIKKLTIKNELKYEYEKKAAADSVRVSEEKKLTTVKLKQEQTQRYYLYCGLGLTALFGIFMFNRFRITQKQKNVIQQQKTIVEQQKHLVDEKQKEILDSIRYAKRIQQSLMPTEKYISRNIKNKKS